MANKYLAKLYTFSTVPHLSPVQIATTLIIIICTRVIIDISISSDILLTPLHLFFELMHTLSFFVLTFIIIASFLHTIIRVPIIESAQFLLWGYFLIIFPPILDRLISHIYFDDTKFQSYYLFDSLTDLLKSFVTYFGDSPHDGITYGTRIMIALALFFITIIAWHKTRNLLRTFGALLGGYTIFFLLSSTPTLLTFLILSFEKSIFAVSHIDVAVLFFSPTRLLGHFIDDPLGALSIKMTLIYVLINTAVFGALFFQYQKKRTIAIVRNIRVLQSIYHIGLLCVGIGLALLFGHAIVFPSLFTFIGFFVLLLSILFAWMSTVFFNDIADLSIDRISNVHRPLPQDTLTTTQSHSLGIIFFVLSIIFALIVTPSAAFFLLLYHALSWFYSMPPFRLKRFPIIATLTAALASITIVITGYVTVSPEHTLAYFPIHIGLLLLFGYMIALPIKDFRDHDGDRANGIWTIPVLFGKKTARILIGVGLFSVFIASTFVLRDMRLFPLALFVGSVSFLALTARTDKTFYIANRFLPLCIFFLTFLYGLALTKILFF